MGQAQQTAQQQQESTPAPAKLPTRHGLAHKKLNAQIAAIQSRIREHPSYTADSTAPVLQTNGDQQQQQAPLKQRKKIIIDTDIASGTHS